MAMSLDSPEQTKSGWMFIVWWLLWCVAVAIPAVALGTVFPKCALPALLTAMAIFFAYPAFAAGYEWDRAECTHDVRKQAKGLLWTLIALLISLSARDLYKAISNRDMTSATSFTMMAGCILAGLFAGFWLGRVFGTGRERRTDA
jgi:hypothetical protein